VSSSASSVAAFLIERQRKPSNFTPGRWRAKPARGACLGGDITWCVPALPIPSGCDGAESRSIRTVALLGIEGTAAHLAGRPRQIVGRLGSCALRVLALVWYWRGAAGPQGVAGILADHLARLSVPKCRSARVGSHIRNETVVSPRYQCPRKAAARLRMFYARAQSPSCGWLCAASTWVNGRLRIGG